MQNFKSLESLDKLATPSIAVAPNNPEGTKLRRTASTVTENKWTEENDEVKFDDLRDGDTVEALENEQSETIQKTQHNEYLTLFEGVRGTFWQGEYIVKVTAKTQEVTAKTQTDVENLLRYVAALDKKMDRLEEVVKTEMGCYIKKGSNAQRKP